MEIEASQSINTDVLADILAAHGVTEESIPEPGELVELPTSIYILALKKSVPIEECANLKVASDKDGRRRVTGTYTFDAADGKVNTYKVSQFIRSLPLPDGQERKRKRSPKKEKVAAESLIEEAEDMESRVGKLLVEVQSLKKSLNKRQKKKAKQAVAVPEEPQAAEATD